MVFSQRNCSIIKHTEVNESIDHPQAVISIDKSVKMNPIGRYACIPN